MGAGDETDTDEPTISWAGKIQSDIRFRVATESVGSYYDRLSVPAGVARNENVLGLKFQAGLGDVKGVADIDLVLLGYPDKIAGISGLAHRDQVDPYRFDIHSLFVEVKNLGIDGLDLRVGQQLVMWGVGDQFNPTNNLNADDVEDPLRFGDQLGNVMVKLDYWITEDWSASGVLVPIFKPALLPRSAQLGLASVDRLPFVSPEFRYRVHAEQAAMGGPTMGYPTTVAATNIETPEVNFENMQFAFRIAGSIGEHDIALSYYNGRTDFPVPKNNHTRKNETPFCNPENPAQCTKGLLETETTLHYPRMHVYGINLAGEVAWLEAISDVFKPIGYRMEWALVVPERATMSITNDPFSINNINVPAVYDYDGDGYPGGPEPAVVDDVAFAKWVFGLDYTFNEYLYTNIQWVHGFVDEYGAGDYFHDGKQVAHGGVTSDDTTTIMRCLIPLNGTECAREMTRPRLADYLVIGFDFKFLEERALARILTILYLNGVWEDYWDSAQQKRVREYHNMFTDEGFSAVVYAEFNYNFGNGLELGFGGLVMLGNEYSKFGHPANGGSLVWTRGRYSF